MSISLLILLLANWTLMLVVQLGVIFIAALLCGALLSGADSQSTAEAARKSARANALVQAGKPEQAIPLYKELAASFPNELSFGTNLAVALYKAGFYRETITQCNAMLKRQPDLLPAWLFLGASELKLGSFSAAEQPLRKVLALNANDPNARIMLADALLAMEHWAEAAEEYERSAVALPDSPRVFFGLGKSYEALAEESLIRVEKLAPNSAAALALSAGLEFGRGQISQSLQHFRQALQLQPSFRGIHLQVSEIYESTGHPDWAATERTRNPQDNQPCDTRTVECEFVTGHLRDVAAAQTDSPESIYWQANAFLALSRQSYRRLEELPPSAERYEAAAIAAEKRGRYPAAADAWKEALRMDPANIRLERQLALALCHSNDCVSALPILKRQLAREPDSPELNYLCGLAFNTTRDPRQALPYLERAVQFDDKFVPAHAALGEAYLETGQAARAIPHLKLAVSDDDGSHRYQLARAFQAAGMHEQAKTVLHDYQEIMRRRSAEQTAITPP